MFWRNPKGRSSSSNWPRCNASLKGEVVDLGKIVGEAKSNLWLHVHEIKQPGKSSFVATEPEGCWMPFLIQQFVLEEVPEQ